MRQLVRSKSWWSVKLSRLKRVQVKVLRQKRNSLINEEVYQETKKIHQKVIYEAIKSLWDIFLTNARGAEVFRAYDYSKQRQLNKLPSLLTAEG
jgi:hypothetical protein